MQAPPEERRHCFRTQQEVLFDCKPVDSHTAQQRTPEEALGASRPMERLEELRRIDRDLQLLGAAISEKDRLLGDYLHKLNQKIDNIAHRDIFAAAVAHELPSELSVSESGVAFTYDRALYVGNYLLLQIIFLPSYTPVIVFARVTRCDADDQHYRVAAEFFRLRDSDRQELAKHVLKAQVSQRKRATTPENKL